MVGRVRCVRTRLANRTKIFCIGRNKTGTTSIAAALRELGFHVAPQDPAERMLDQWAVRDFRRLISFCRWFEAFQDYPFSLADSYRALDEAFPGSKFVLTTRDPGEWFQSLTRFHSRMFGDGSLPTMDQLDNATYCYRGFMGKAQRMVYGVDAGNLYERERYVEHFNQHYEDVRAYFRNRPEDFLEIDVAVGGSYQRLCKFLGVVSDRSEFPWKNQS